jgi:hypothetical protein
MKVAITEKDIPFEHHYAILIFTQESYNEYSAITWNYYPQYITKYKDTIKYNFTLDKKEWLQEIKRLSTSGIKFAAIEVKSRAKIKVNTEIVE